MKKICPIILIILFFMSSLQAKDYHKTREMIESILSEEGQSSSGSNDQAGDGQAVNDDTGRGENIPGKEGEEKTPEKKTMTGKDESIYKSAIQLFESGFYDHSLLKFNDIIQNHPESRFLDNSRVWAGRIYIKQYRYDEAIREFDSVSEGSGEYPASLYYRA